MQSLDINTIIFLISKECLLFVLILSFFMFSNSNYYRKINLYVLSRIIQGITWVMIMTRAESLNNLTMILSNVFLISGVTLELYCILSIDSKKLKTLRKIFVTGALLEIILYTIFCFNIELRVIISSFFITTLFLFLFVIFTFSSHRTKTKTLIGWLGLIIALIHLFRAIFVIISRIQLPIFSNETIQIISGTTWLFFAFTFPLFFLFLLKEKENERLHQLNNTKNKFFRIIAHDMKSPINQMIQLSQIIEIDYTELSNEKLLMYIRAMKDSSDRGLIFLESLLEWASSQTGSITYKPANINLNNLVDNNIELLKKNAHLKQIALLNNVDPNTMVYVDKNMINTVIRNLISNAIKFTHHSGTIEIGCIGLVDQVKVYVKDNGVGMSDDVCKTLFNLESRHVTKGTDNEKGSGIGLMLCKEFIDLHKGEIWVESEINKGSTFYFTIAKSKSGICTND